MDNGRCDFAAVQSGRRVFVFCGQNGSGPLSTTAVLDLETMAVTEGPNMLSERAGRAAIAIEAHRVLVVGGYSGDNHLNTTEILDLEALTFTAGPPCNQDELSSRSTRAAFSWSADRMMELTVWIRQCWTWKLWSSQDTDAQL